MKLCCFSCGPKWDEAVDFGFYGEVRKAKVVSVYDGDTVKIAFPLNKKMYRWNCRISGVDTPEIRTKDPDEKAMGYKVRDVLSEKILNKVVKVVCGRFDKYGRLLIDIYINGISIGEWLISNGYAFQYDGGTKQSWSEYLKNNNV